MHIAQQKELDVHKTKQKRDRNRTTTSLVLDSSMQRGRWEFRLISEFGCLYRQYLRAAEYLFSRYFLLFNTRRWTQDVTGIFQYYVFSITTSVYML